MESELSFGIGLEELKRNPDDILDLAEALAVSKNIRLIICIDEFQNVANFGDSLAFQKKLRAIGSGIHMSLIVCLVVSGTC